MLLTAHVATDGETLRLRFQFLLLPIMISKKVLEQEKAFGNEFNLIYFEKLQVLVLLLPGELNFLVGDLCLILVIVFPIICVFPPVLCGLKLLLDRVNLISWLAICA